MKNQKFIINEFIGVIQSVLRFNAENAETEQPFIIEVAISEFENHFEKSDMVVRNIPKLDDDILIDVAQDIIRNIHNDWEVFTPQATPSY